MSVLRVATINVWNKAGPWLARLPLIRRELERLAPEVVGLQEVLRFRPDSADAAAAPLSAQNDQATEIAEGLGFHIAYSVASDYGNGLKFGNALFFAASDRRAAKLPAPGQRERGDAVAALCIVRHPSWKSTGVRHAPELEVPPRRRSATPSGVHRRARRGAFAD